jgi:hypothetical protein
MESNKLKHIERVTKLMDSQFNIGGFRFGIDPLLNFIPLLSDGISVIISGLMIMSMAKYGASGKVKAKMILNIAIDAVIGAIPVLGWFFDFYFKANERNLILLRQHYNEGKHQGSSKSIILWLILIIVSVIVLSAFLILKIGGWLLNIF